MYWLHLFGCFLTIIHVKGQAGLKSGTCPNYTVMPDFDFLRAKGQWYAVYYATVGRSYDFPCHSSVPTADDNGILTITAKYKKGDVWKTFTVRGPQDGDRPGKWLVEESFSPGLVHINTILDTDYDNYIAHVRCANHGNNTYSYAVIVKSRKRTISEESLNKARIAFEKAGLDSTLTKIPQDNC